jgi:hypothetical protein
MKELRLASKGRSEVRILYAFDFRRRAVLLLGGDKAGQWKAWYNVNVPIADTLFARHEEEAREREALSPTAGQSTGKKSKGARGRRKP